MWKSLQRLTVATQAATFLPPSAHPTPPNHAPQRRPTHLITHTARMPAHQPSPVPSALQSTVGDLVNEVAKTNDQALALTDSLSGLQVCALHDVALAAVGAG